MAQSFFQPYGNMSVAPNQSMMPNQSMLPKQTLNYTPANFTPSPTYYQTPATFTPATTQSFWKQYSTPTPAPKAAVAPKPVAKAVPKANLTTNKTGQVAGTSNTNPADTGLSEEQQYINDMYAPAYEALTGQLGNLQANFDLGRSHYQTMYDPYYQQLSDARQSGMDANAQNVTQTRQQQQSAIDQASNLYGELQQRNQQLYGGASSAGQFGSELQGRQLQQNVGQATQTATANLQTLQRQAEDINSNYETQKSSLDQQKSAALIQLEQDFNMQKSAIENQIGQIGTDKATAKYQALKDYNAAKQQILQSAQNFGLQLETNAYQAKQQVQAAIAQAAAAMGQTPDLSAFKAPQFASAQQGVSGNADAYVQSLPPYLRKYYGLG